MSASKHLFKLEYSLSPLPWKLMINKTQLPKSREKWAFIFSFLDKNFKSYDETEWKITFSLLIRSQNKK